MRHLPYNPYAADMSDGEVALLDSDIETFGEFHSFASPRVYSLEVF